MNTKQDKRRDPLTSYQLTDVQFAVNSLEKEAGTLNKLAAVTGVPRSTYYNVKRGVVTETAANRIMNVVTFFTKNQVSLPKSPKPKEKELKQDLTDLSIAHKYCNKAANAKEAGHEFDLSLDEYKELLLQPRCYYTNVPMTRTQSRQEPVGTDVTLDRVDNHVGYISGNVVACCYASNQFKAFVENPKNELSLKGALMVLNKTNNLLTKNTNN